ERELDGCTLQLGKSAGITIFHESVDHLRASVMPRFQAACDEHGWDLRLSMTWTCINADLSFMSKANGIRRLIDRLGVRKDELLGIGDTMSDLAIRQEVGRFACPSNAAEELKPHADDLAEAPEARGVLEILNTLTA
ncbi:MAG: HAD hydrolase family protein, partial [Planctomycetota bacterium]